MLTRNPASIATVALSLMLLALLFAATACGSASPTAPLVRIPPASSIPSDVGGKQLPTNPAPVQPS